MMPGIIGFPQLDPGHDGGGKPSDKRTNQDSTRIITPEELEFVHDSNAYGLAIYDTDQDASVQQPSSVMPPTNNPIFNKEKAIEHNERTRREREAARNKQSTPSLPVVPEDLPAETKPDISETEVFEVCGQVCQQNPQTMKAVMNLIEGFDPDDDEQTLEERVSNHLRIMGLNDAVGYGDWYTTRLGPIVEGTASLIADYYFDRVETSKDVLATMPVAQAESTPSQNQLDAGTGQHEQPEINLTTQYYLKETYTEWNSSWTEKKDLENFLKGRLKAFFDGFDETSVNWDALTVEELIVVYRNHMAAKTAVLWNRYQDTSHEYYQLIQAEFDRATGLLSMAQAIPLDDSEAYAAAFGIADAEVQRKHVQDQLAVIYKHLNIEMPENYFDSRSTTELNYELYYRLNYDVPWFMGLDENEQGDRIGKFLREYHEKAQLRPEDVIDRLQGTYHQPDVLGFLFIMGLSIAFEPVDYLLTAVDVIQALSEGDTESAIGNIILGVTPGVSSKLDDLILPLLGRIDNVRLLPARAGLPPRHTLRARGFTDEMIDAFEFRGATGPGTDLAEHRKILGDGPEHTSAVITRGDRLGHRAQDSNAQILREQYGYNIISEPRDDMFRRAGIDTSGRTPDYFIEGKPFDAYAVSPPRDPNAPEATLINTVWNTIYEKVPGQTNRLVIDLSHTPITSERFIEDMSQYYVKGQPLTDITLKELKEIKFMRDGRLTDVWVNPML